VALFTLILRTGEFTHMTQVRADSAAEAFRVFGKDLPRLARHPGLADVTLTDADPILIGQMLGVWKGIALAGTRLEDVHLVETCEPPA
jgi:hypothetical protein